MKTIWITSLARDPARVQKILSLCANYGLDPDGHFWEDDLKKMAWIGPRETLTDAGRDVALWIVLTDDERLAAPSVRYGLSMLTLSAQGIRGPGFVPMLVHEGTLPTPESLPTPLRGAEILPADSASLGAKIVAKANMPAKRPSADYRLDVYAMPQLGQWIEVGPASGEWAGALFGTVGGEIAAHGAGPAGRLPRTAVLEYPMQGLQLALGEREYTAWAIQNRIDPETSYFVKFSGEPDAVIFGPLGEGEAADVFVLDLK